MYARRSIAILLLTLGACSSADDMAQDIGVDEGSASASASASTDGADKTTASANSTPDARNVSVSTDDFEFAYAYPASAAAIPELRERLEKRLAEARSSLEKDAAEAKADAEANDFPYRAYSSMTKWEQVADIPGWLSMSAEYTSYTGGAHGNLGYGSMVWDKTGKRWLEPEELFRSPVSLENAVASRFCAELDRQREKRRGQKVDKSNSDFFSDCPRIDELTVLLGSSNGQTFDRIGLIAAPYVAGPWAEGSYEITVPVNTSVMDAVKHEYETAFSLQR